MNIHDKAVKNMIKGYSNILITADDINKAIAHKEKPVWILSEEQYEAYQDEMGGIAEIVESEVE